MTVILYNKNKNRKMFRVNRLVATAFIPNPEKKEQVNHKDGNKLNNNVDNLEWVTQKENQYHAWENGLNKNKPKEVNQYDLNNSFIREWESAREIERQTKINRSNIACCCRGERKTAGGYIWRYK